MEPLPALIVTRGARATDCPDAAALAREVERMNGKPSIDPAATGPVRTRLHVEIEHATGGYSAVIRALGAKTGERRLTDLGPGCGNLADALALTLALILDDEKRSSIAPEGPEERAARLEPNRQDRGATEPNATVRGAVEAAAGIQAGALPRPSLVAAARGRLEIADGVLLEAGGFIAPAETIDHATSDGQVTLELASAFAGVCLRLAGAPRTTSALVCAEPYVGRLRGTGHGFDVDRPPQNHLWLAGGLALEGQGAIAGPLFWIVRAAGLAVTKQRFLVRVNGIDDAIYESAPAALLGWAGVGLHFE